MGNGQTISDGHFIARAAATAACVMMLSGCMTHAAKDKQVAEAAEPVPEVVMRTPGEQLAAQLNAKAQVQAQAQARKPGQYRDPQVRTASGQQLVAQQQSATGLYPLPPQAASPAAMAPANIGGLVTQPTAVNANRSSIYAAPAPIAVNPDGTLAPISAYAAPGAMPSLRSVYSLPPGTLPEQPQPVIAPPQAVMGPPQPNQSAQGAVVPHYAPKIASASVGRPTADATPSRILPAPGSKGRHLDSAEALMMARNMASGGQKAPVNTMMPQASSGLTLPPGVSLPPGVTLTPGMAASLK